jgi:hypothetical protein
MVSPKVDDQPRIQFVDLIILRFTEFVLVDPHLTAATDKLVIRAASNAGI